MEAPLFYIKTLFVSPAKAFEKLIESTGYKKTIITFILFLAVFAALRNFIPPQDDYSANKISMFIKSIVDVTQSFGFIVAPLLWFLTTFLLHAISRLFSQAGKYVQLLITTGLVNVIFTPVNMLITILVLQNEGFGFLSTIANFWLLYLQIVAVSIVYQISKKKALLIMILNILAMVIIFAVLLFGYYFLFVKPR